MFAGAEDAQSKAERIVAFFVDHREHQSHALGIDRDQARKRGVVIVNLERNQALQDAVLSVHHAAIHTLAGPAIKIVENHLGRGFFKVAQAVQVQTPFHYCLRRPRSGRLRRDRERGARGVTVRDTRTSRDTTGIHSATSPTHPEPKTTS